MISQFWGSAVSGVPTEAGRGGNIYYIDNPALGLRVDERFEKEKEAA